MTDDLYNPLLSPNIDDHIDYYIKCRNTTYDDTYNSAWLDGAIIALKDYRRISEHNKQSNNHNGSD